jgi:hypothetical protein
MSANNQPAPAPQTPYFKRLVLDAWAAVAVFLAHEDLAALSRASRALREVACANGVWEWLLRRDFGHGPLQLAEERWGWVGRGGLPGARDDRDFVRGYYRLLRSVPPAPARFDAADVAAVDELFRAAPLAWRPARQIHVAVSVLRTIYDAWPLSAPFGRLQGRRGYLAFALPLATSRSAVLADGERTMFANKAAARRTLRRRERQYLRSISNTVSDDDDDESASRDEAAPWDRTVYTPTLQDADRRRLVATRLDPQIGFRAAAARSIYRVLQRFAPISTGALLCTATLHGLGRCGLLPGAGSAVSAVSSAVLVNAWTSLVAFAPRWVPVALAFAPSWAEQLVGGACGRGGTLAAAGLVAAWAVKRGYHEGSGQSRALRHLNGWTGPLLVSVLGAGVQSYCVARLVHSASFRQLVLATLASMGPQHVTLLTPVALSYFRDDIAVLGWSIFQKKALAIACVGLSTASAVMVASATLQNLAEFAVRRLGPLFVSTSTTPAISPSVPELELPSPVTSLGGLLFIAGAWMLLDAALAAKATRVRGSRLHYDDVFATEARTLTATLIDAVEFGGAAYRPANGNRARWTRAYSVLSTGVSIAVAAATGGDAHKAALAKAGAEVAFGLLHHVGRVIAHSTTRAPDVDDE